MGLFDEGVKSVFKAISSSGPAEERYRLGVEKAMQQLMLGMEYENEGDFRQGLKALNDLSDQSISDNVLLYEKYKLHVQLSVRLAQQALAQFKNDLKKASKGIVDPDELKTPEVLRQEVIEASECLRQKHAELVHLMRQPFSHKNDDDTRRSKQAVKDLEIRKDVLETALLLARSRGAERQVMESSLVTKVSTLLKEAFSSLVKLNGLENLPARLREDSLEVVVEGKAELNKMKNELKAAVAAMDKI